MLATRVLSFTDPAGLGIGLAAERRKGLTPRGLLFLAIDPRGTVHVAVPEDPEEVTKVRVGDKLSLTPPWAGRYYHFDAIHRLPVGVLWNGDRRLAQPGSAPETAAIIADWVKGFGARNVFLGCTPHQPGTWWMRSDRSPALPLHDRGFVDVVTTGRGLLARRIVQPHLYTLPLQSLAGPEALLDGWQPVFTSTLGNILLLERRVLGDHLVLTCERGLLELDVTDLASVRATAEARITGGFGVVGRVDGGAFAVTFGKPEPWGLSNVEPATLVGAEGVTLLEMARSLEKAEGTGTGHPGS
jgi:hypothetical protein